MENILTSTVFVFAIFVAYSIAVYQSKKACQPAAIGDAAPPSESVEQSISQPDNCPFVPTDGEGVESVLLVKEYPITKHFTVNNSQANSVADKPATELSELTIRQLKQLASQKKVKRYGRMTKAELIAALS